MGSETKPIPSQEVLQTVLDIDADNGRILFRRRDPSLFSHCKDPEHRCAAWNGQFADKEAFTCLTNRGYRIGAIFGEYYFAHRVIYKYFHGEAPLYIDHIDGDKLNNSLINLRSVTQSENCQNRRLSTRNTSGVVGVTWIDEANKWRAYIKVGGIQRHLGEYSDIEMAKAARRGAERALGFHKNHGLEPLHDQ